MKYLDVILILNNMENMIIKEKLYLYANTFIDCYH